MSVIFIFIALSLCTDIGRLLILQSVAMDALGVPWRYLGALASPVWHNSSLVYVNDNRHY